MAVVNDVLFDFAYDASHVAMVRMAVKPRFLVSARSKPIRSIDQSSSRRSSRPSSASRTTAASTS